MIEVRQSAIFMSWFRGLRDRAAQKRISQRIGRLPYGLLGDAKAVGSGVMELRIDHGPGYRLYFIKHGQTLIMLLCGGDKRSQTRDIDRAIAMAADLAENGMEDGSWL